MAAPYPLRRTTFIRSAGILLLVGLIAWALAGSGLLRPAQQPLPTAPTTFPAFTDLPAASSQPTSRQAALYPPAPANAVRPGTASAITLRPPADRAGQTFAILGDRSAGFAWGEKYLQAAVAELNILKPEMVFTIGDMVQGYTRSGSEYAAEAEHYRGIVDALTMPWFPCAGNHDVISGTGDPHDTRFEKLYQQYFGPLYYSVDDGAIHVITLFSDEQLDNTPRLSAPQLAWLKDDLDHYFRQRIAAGGGGQVFVLMHRPLWRDPNSNWDQAQALLAAFNQRPIVGIEGLTGPLPRQRPRVQAVFAGHLHSYSQDPPRDGIDYYTLSVTGGAIDQDPLAGQFQGYYFVKTDAAGYHLALVEIGHVHGPGFVTAADRAIAARIAGLSEKAMGITGTLPQPVGHEVGTHDPNAHLLQLNLSNPLDVPIDVALRLSSAQYLSTPTRKDNANIFTDNYDSDWQLVVPYGTFHLLPGAHKNYSMALYSPAMPGPVAPPQVEFVVSFLDSQGRNVPTVLRRRVPLVPSLAVPMLAQPPADRDWFASAVHGATYSFIPNVYDPVEASPEFDLLADPENLYIKLHVDDKTFSYYPQFDSVKHLLSDAVALSFAPENAGLARPQQLVVLPFAPAGPLWLSAQMAPAGPTTAAAPLERLDAQHAGVQAVVTTHDDSYDLLLTVPLKLLGLSAKSEIRLNLAVIDNDGGALSTRRAWAREDLGPPAWGQLTLKKIGGTPVPPTP